MTNLSVNSSSEILANQAYQNGEYEQAVNLFSTARDEYNNQGDTIKSAEMANNMAVTYLRIGNHKKALEACQGTDEIFAVQGDLKRQAMSLGNQASALEGLHQHELAEKKFLQSAELLEKAGEPELESLIYKSISALQLHCGKRMDAIYSMQKALSLKKNLTFKEKLIKILYKLQVNFFK